MAYRSIEEEFRAIAPPRRRGIPAAAPISLGAAGSGGADTLASLSQAATELAQLRAQYQTQSDFISANTEATSYGGSSIADGIGNFASGGVAGAIGGGGIGFLSPIVSGILSLFGGAGSAPAPLPYYAAPPSVQLDEALRSAAGAGAPNAPSAAGNSAGPQIAVNVSAMDSQSFMDRSNDIANAVREAMLNLHPINNVVANL